MYSYQMLTKGAVCASVLIFCLPDTVNAQATRGDDVIRGLDQAQARREASLTGYSVTERYAIHNTRFNTTANMLVEAVFNRVTGKSYRVISRSGSPLLQTRIFDKLLKEEAELSHGAPWQQSRVTSANYRIRLEGEEVVRGRHCEVLELVPRVKGPYVLKGRAWVDSKEFSLVRIEGRPTVSPSFLAGRTVIVRDYDNIDGFAFATRSHAVSESFLLGRTELTIDYYGFQVRMTP